MLEPLRAQGRVGVFPETIAGALAYFTVIPAIVFLTLDPYRKNAFTRYHAWQSIFFSAGTFVIGVVMWLLSLLLLFIPTLGQLLVALLSGLIGLAAVLIWVVLVVKALQGEAFKLNVIGDYAERQAGNA